MTINVSYTKVEYSIYRPDEANAELTHREVHTLNVCDGRVTAARISREIPKGAFVENITKVDKRFYVVGENLIAWLAKNGTEVEK